MIDREMIYPKALETTLPPYMNHIQHSFPLISVLLDMLLIDHYTHPPKALRVDLLMVGGVTVAYMAMLVWVFATEGRWVYPFIGMMLSPTYLYFCYLFIHVYKYLCLFSMIHSCFYKYPFCFYIILTSLVGLLPDYAKALFFIFGMGLAWVFYFGGVFAGGRLWKKAKQAIKIKSK